ncbi:MAG TPA: carboxypeptidase-like regulatory domain-containing protein [Chitinophagaceae bacterium]
MHPKPSLLLSINVFLFLSFQQLQAQSIQGIIKDANSKPLQFANVLLLRSADSSLIKGMITDATEKYFFENMKTGKYIITATFTEMTQVYTNLFEITADKKETDIGDLSLKNADGKLKDITIAVKNQCLNRR